MLNGWTKAGSSTGRRRVWRRAGAAAGRALGSLCALLACSSVAVADLSLIHISEPTRPY